MQAIDLKRFMFEQNIKQKELVEYLGVSKGYISLVISGQRQLSNENLSKLINNPFGWDTSILVGASKEDVSENHPQNPMEEKPEDDSMVRKLLFIVESQRKDIETLIQLIREKDAKIADLMEESMKQSDEISYLKFSSTTYNKGETATSVGSSLLANVGGIVGIK